MESARKNMLRAYCLRIIASGTGSSIYALQAYNPNPTPNLSPKQLLEPHSQAVFSRTATASKQSWSLGLGRLALGNFG